MTVKIHIPSSDSPDEPTRPDRDDGRPGPGPMALITASVLTVGVLIVLMASILSGGGEPESTVPAPFEASEPAPPVTEAAVRAWSERILPGAGEILAMGTVGGTPVAVVLDWPELYVWAREEGDWHLEGTPDLDGVQSAVVMDDRVLFVGDLQGRPTVWEWVVGGAVRYLFQPTSGFVADAWSVDGSLIVAVTGGPGDTEESIRYGRQDSLWVEGAGGEFREVELIGLETVLAVGGEAGEIAVGGRDAEGRAAIGFIDDGQVQGTRLPAAPDSSAVTDLAGERASLIALVSVADRPTGIGEEIRSVAADWERIVETPDLVGIAVIDARILGVGVDGTVVAYGLDGEERAAPPMRRWSYGSVNGLALLGDEPVVYGQSEGTPVYVGPSAAAANVVMPVGRWERYHSEASDGFRLFHIGSLEFAVRDAELFYRAWNADRWRPAEFDGPAALYAAPRILEVDWGFVMVPSAGTGLWTSADGATWQRVEGSDAVRVQEVASDGQIVVGTTHLGAVGGPMSDVTVLAADGEIQRLSLPYHIVGPTWDAGVGFAATIAPPETGHALSQDGLEWTQHAGSDVFEWVVPFDGALYLGSGESVVAGDPPAATPGGEGWLFTYGEVPAWQSEAGSTWIHTGDEWVDVGFDVVDGLPGRPHTLVVRDSTIFAMTDGIDGSAETYVIQLD